MTQLQLIDNIKVASKKYGEQNLLNHYKKKFRNICVRYYFDSYDIIKMIEGIRSFEYFSFRDQNFFQEPASLVRALAYFGEDNLNIGLLSGHQEEVAYYINSFIAPLNIEDKLISEFFSQVGLSNFDINKKTDHETLKNQVEELKNNSPELYILNYILDESNWLKRADYLLNKRIFVDTLEIDENFFSNEVFKLVHNFFEKNRPKSIKNNFRDALSLYSIYQKLELFKEGKLKELPIYFASTKLMKKIKSEKNIVKYYDVEILDKPFNLIQDSEFLILDLLFSKTSDDILLDQFNEFNKLPTSKVVDLEDYEKEIKFDTESTIDFQIFDKLFFPEKKHILCDKIKKFLDSRSWDEMKNDIGKEKLKIKKGIIHKLNVNKTTLKLMTKIWSESYSFMKKAESIDFNEYDKTSDPFKEFGLTRFSFETGKEVSNYINNKAFKSLHNKEEFLDFRGDFISRLYKSLKNESHIYELEKIIAVLWIFESYSAIVTILKYNDYYDRLLSLYLIYCVALLKSSHSTSEVVRNLDLIENYDSGRKKYLTDIGLGYIYFNLWAKNNKDLELIPEYNSGGISTEYAKKSIELLKSAVDWLKKEKDKDEKEKRNTKYLYALNNYIYYVTRTSDKEVFNKLKKYAELLSKQSAVETIFTHWQNRFEDTLALYYFRRAILEINEGSYKLNMKFAKEHIKEAMKYGIDEKKKIKQTSLLINKTKKEHISLIIEN